MKRFKILLLSVMVIFSGFAVLPAIANAATKDDICQGVSLTGGTCTGGDTDINKVIQQVINILSIIVGVIAVIMIIIGGLRYITSGGDSNNISGAKNTIIYAVIGLVVVAMAQVIVRFVLSKF